MFLRIYLNILLPSKSTNNINYDDMAIIIMSDERL